jgi:hypothetical protein
LLGTVGLVSAGRQWVDQLERPPNEMAKLHWQRAKSAASAGANAWQKHPMS